MSAKVERSKRIRVVLDRSLEQRSLVRLTRTLRGTEAVDGVVVAVGIRWVILSRLSPDLDLDGYRAVRWKHVRRAQAFEPGSLPARATTAAAVAPAPGGVADATTTGSLLRSLEVTGAPLALHAEAAKPPITTVGVVDGFLGKAVQLTPIFPLDDGERLPVVVPFEVISRIDFWTRYLAGLARATGMDPAAGCAD